MKQITLLLLILFTLISSALNGQQIVLDNLKAFPTAEGFGENTTGGRGGRIVKVTNLNSNGPGSLDAALRETGPRIIVFTVGGTIIHTGNDYLDIKEANGDVTIAGETAPGGGILIRGAELRISASNVIVRNLRFRQDSITSTESNRDAIKIRGFNETTVNNVIIDHCSISWALDENVAIANAENITFQRSIVSENIKSFLIQRSKNVSVLNTIHALTNERNIRANTVDHLDLTFEQINNLIYGVRFATQPTDGLKVTVENNVYEGSSQVTLGNSNAFNRAAPNPVNGETNTIENSYFYVNGNDIGPYSREIAPNIDPQYVKTTPLYRSSYVPKPTAGLKDTLLLYAGAFPRDSHDIRIINHINSGTGVVAQTGVFPIIAGGTADADTNNNGISDIFENQHNITGDGTGVTIHWDFGAYQVVNNAGYSDLEIYLAWLAKDFDILEKQQVNLNVNGEDLEVTSYPGGPDQGAFEVLENKTTLKLSGNSWKKTDMNYTITPNTVVEFEFKINTLAELHGIGFDSDTSIDFAGTGLPEEFFKLAGTQGVNWDNEDYNNYSTADMNSNDGWKSYSIPLGDYLTGDIAHIVFFGDKDNGDKSLQESFFRNITFREEPSGLLINGEDQEVTSYPGGPDQGAFEVLENGTTLKLSGNSWKKANMNYTITPNTVVEFEFKINILAELHGIGFDSDTSIDFAGTGLPEEFFKLAGTQGVNWDNEDYNNYNTTDMNSNDGWKSYSIPLGDYLTGDIAHIVFFGDKDNGDTSLQESFFRNITFREEPTGILINAIEREVVTYADDNGFNEVLNSGSTLRLYDNSWKRADLNYNITPNTILEFEFKVTGLGEIHGIGVDNDNSFGSNSNQAQFQLAGTQNAPWANQTYRDYTTADMTVNNGWKTYRIPVGDFVTGNFSYVTFIADKDSNPTVQESFFRNINFKECESIFIPDAKFEQVLIEIGADSDGIVNQSICRSDAESVINLDLDKYMAYQDPNADDDEPVDVTGLEAFINLESLKCDSCLGIANLDLSPNVNLKTLRLVVTDVSTLNLSSNTNLESLDIRNNVSLSSLNLANNPNLQVVGLFSNGLTSLNLRNGNNQNITILDVQGNPSLNCVEVDNPSAAAGYSGWFKSSHTLYSADCSVSTNLQSNLINTEVVSPEMIIFPNPAMSKVTIQGMQGKKQIRLIDMTGRVLYETTSSDSEKELDMGAYPNGFYFVQVKGAQKTEILRLVKQ
ncbi:T9SS type A sorting domain-containing protein [Spongiimicrobium salis]|uniref:T9SS type A sorting domain-containing protein n=1 Tax=Spongiimicrobium salis TaxID=1667022 RepID=UPI00374CEC62